MAGKKRIFIIVFAIIAFVFAGIILKKGEFSLFDRVAIISHYDVSPFEETAVIAVCPTFHYMFEKLEESKDIRIIKTQSTAESLNLLKQGSVDLVISGRALKPEEPGLLFKIIGPGYDFIFNEEIVILENEMEFVPFYTDLDREKIINDFGYISENNLARVEDVYEYLSKGVVITLPSVSEGGRKNFSFFALLGDGIKGEAVHILKKDGSRVRLSRLPRLYYFSGFEEEKLNFIEEIIKEN